MATDNAWGVSNLLSFQRPDQMTRPPDIMVTPAVTAWEAEVARYKERWDWFTGERLKDLNYAVKDDGGNHPPLYPLRINDIELVCLIHAAALFGRFPEKSKSLIEVTYQNADDEEDEACLKLASLMNQIWDDSHGKEIQGTAGLMCQFLGGAAFGVRYDPLDPWLRHQTKFQLVTPNYFLPIYDNADPWNLLEAYIMYYIGVDEAREKYGITVTSDVGGKVLYMEHWTRTRYSRQIGGQTPVFRVGEVEIVEDGVNPYGFVPFVYIPHYPRVGGFYGASHVDRLVGLVQEKNYRLADIGDYVKASAIVIPWIANVISGLKSRQLIPGLNAVDLGTNNMGKEPKLDIASFASTGGGNVYETLRELLNEEIVKQGNLSSVVLGLEEGGTQRSGVTVATRIYPLESHINLERSLWNVGYSMLHRMALRVMLAKGVEGVDESMLKLSPNVTWYPILPADRAALVDEVVQRMSVEAISLENSVHKLSTGEDEKQEIERIKAARAEQAQQKMAEVEAQAKIKAENAPKTLDNNKG